LTGPDELPPPPLEFDDAHAASSAAAAQEPTALQTMDLFTLVLLQRILDQFIRPT
jgi:hypothetical protein